MKIKNNPSNPSFADLELLIKENVKILENIEIYLDINTNDEHEFKFSLRGESGNNNFIIETRIAIERHSQDSVHKYPHIQWNVNNKNSEFFTNGVLHITLIVDSTEDLLNCCGGFLYSLKECLNYFEEELSLEKGILSNYFLSDEIDSLEEKKYILHSHIEKSYSNERLNKDEQNSLIEIKRRKTEILNDFTMIRKLFFILKLIKENPILKPILEIPTINQINQIPEIKRRNLSFEECKKSAYLLIDDDYDVEKMTPSIFLNYM